MKLPVCFIGILFILLLTATVSFSSSFSGLPITQVVIQDDAGKPWSHPEELAPLIVIRPGDALSRDAVSDGISYLFLKGIFEDIRVDAFPDNGGVKVVYTLTPVTVVDRIEMSGNHVFSRSKILEAIPGIEGKELREDRFSDYWSAIGTLYQAEGYYDTVVEFNVEKLAQPRHVVLRITIRETKPTIIGSITFLGNTVFTGKQLAKVMKSKAGKPLMTNLLLDTDMAAIVDKYTAAGYPTAKPGPVDISFRDGKAYVRIMGTEGPKINVRFSGNSASSDSELSKQLLIIPEHDISDSVIESSADKIRNLYKEDGFADAVVDVKKISETGTIDLNFEIREGNRITVKKILIRGNEYFPANQLKAEMSLKESGLFRKSPYREDLLNKDVEYIRDRYADEGFLKASVSKTVDFVENGRKAMIMIDVEEDAQTRVNAVSFDGNRAFTDRDLLALVSLKPGAPYNERLVDEDRYRILSAYSNKGYLYARVEAEKTLNGTADVKYKITEDRQVLIGRIILRGNDQTKENAIIRELVVKPGDPYDYGKILESQQRIYRLGYFGQAKFEPVHAGQKEYVKDLLLTVEERPAGAVEISAGYGDFDRARGSLELFYRNLWGSADYASIRLEESNVIKRAAFTYHQPWVLDYPIDGKFGLEWSNAKRLNQDTREIYYQTRKTTISYGLEKVHRRLKASLTYRFENVENYNVLEQLMITPEDQGRVRVSSITPSLVWDFRDDIFNPRRGSLHGIALKEAMSLLGSQADFTKLTVQSSWYIPVTPDIVAAVAGRGGMAWTHGETIEIPLHERFYAGGSTTVRGYTQDSVGPSKPGPDNKPVPQGGASMVIFNAELRLNPGGGFGFVLFSDAGRVWRAQDAESERNNDLRASYGAGIRYGTPIGPLRIDYGQKIHRRSDESPGELHFNIGHTF